MNPGIIEKASPFHEKGWTVFVLDLDISDQDFRIVRSMLQDLRAEMLLFTRRLTHLAITFPGIGPMAKSETITHQLSVPNQSTPTIRAIDCGCTRKKMLYVVHESLVSNMPVHLSRPDVTESRIMLAFPFDPSKGPVIQDQQIFAFLPLRKTPLKVWNVSTHANTVVFGAGRFSHTNKPRRYP
jgi:hypothetical protein